MIDFSQCQKLFIHSSFFAMKRVDGIKSEYQETFSKLVFPTSISSHHPNRKEEFMTGRLCACLAHQKINGELLLELPIGENREPLWPAGIVGSLSHTKDWVGAVVADSTHLLGVGLDFETMGRAREKLSSYITNDFDVVEIVGLTRSELLTLIFSAKESLYKALYPLVNKFFGFDAAAVTQIDLKNKIFTIQLLTQLSPQFGPTGRSTFTGRFECDQQTCLTAIEVTLS